MKMKLESRSVRFWTVLLLLITLLFPTGVSAQTSEVMVIEVEGMITAGTTAFITRAVEEAGIQGTDALVILLNTPGGLVDATLDIISAINTSEVPVITYVAPQGAIAASAGAFILLGGHVAAMSPGTTTGAAMPVMMSPGDDDVQTADDKTVLFLAGHIRSIAETRGRPADVAERFVTENLTLSSTEALEAGITDHTASNLAELLDTIHGETIQFRESEFTLNTANAELVPLTKSLTERITHLISNPQLTFILLLVGVYGLIIGLGNPATFVPEVLGAIALVLALFGLGMFEINLFAIMMIVLGIGLLIAEALTPTYGVLGTGGVVSLVLGIIYLPVEPLVTERWLVQFRLMAIGIGVIGSILMIVILAGLVRLKKMPVRMGSREFSEDIGVVVDPINPKGLIKVRGELWRAESEDGSVIETGTRVRVTERHQLTCVVKAIHETNPLPDDSAAAIKQDRQQ